jgi:hypothetical protein
MTTVDNPDNIVFDSGGDNEFTLLTTFSEEIRSKILKIVPGVVPKPSRSSGVKATRVLDMLQVTRRYTLKGMIDKTDKPKVDALFEQGGPTTILWDSVSYTVNIEKFTYTKDGRDNSERDLDITVVEGNDL